MRKKLPQAFTLVVAIICLLGCTEKKQTDRMAADFTLQDLNGKTVTLSEYRGKVVLLDFWATYCPPCRAEIRDIERIHNVYKNKGLVVLAISLDGGEWDFVKSFMKDYGITYTVLKGTHDVMEQYHVRAIPLLLVLDKEGKIRSKTYEGFGNEGDIEKVIMSLL